MEPNHLEGQAIHPIIGWSPKGNGQVDLPKGLTCFLSTMPWKGFGWSDAQPAHAHGLKRLNVHDVEDMPPSISTLVSRFRSMIGLTMSEYLPSYRMLSG
jgi:hypothetical protein